MASLQGGRKTNKHTLKSLTYKKILNYLNPYILQVYCFIGENGVGKTKLLQTMANIMIYRHVLFSGKIKNIVKNPLFEFGSHNLISEVKDLELLTSDFIQINNGFGAKQHKKTTT